MSSINPSIPNIPPPNYHESELFQYQMQINKLELENEELKKDKAQLIEKISKLQAPILSSPKHTKNQVKDPSISCIAYRVVCLNCHQQTDIPMSKWTKEKFMGIYPIGRLFKATCLNCSETITLKGSLSHNIEKNLINIIKQ